MVWTKNKRVMPAAPDAMLRRQMERAYGRGRELEPLPTTKAGDAGASTDAEDILNISWTQKNG